MPTPIMMINHSTGTLPNSANLPQFNNAAKVLSTGQDNTYQGDNDLNGVGERYSQKAPSYDKDFSDFINRWKKDMPIFRKMYDDKKISEQKIRQQYECMRQDREKRNKIQDTDTTSSSIDQRLVITPKVVQEVREYGKEGKKIRTRSNTLPKRQQKLEVNKNTQVRKSWSARAQTWFQGIISRISGGLSWFFGKLFCSFSLR